MAQATGISRSTIVRGIREIRNKSAVAGGRVRRVGGGRKIATAIDAELRATLERLVDPVSRGDPESALRWTCKSTRGLATELTAHGHPGSDWLVRQMLYELGYSLQANRKTKEGGRHPEWRPRGNPYEVRVHDFIDPSKGKAIPYGVYDLGLNRGWVSVGIDHETASFAVNTILQCA